MLENGDKILNMCISQYHKLHPFLTPSPLYLLGLECSGCVFHAMSRTWAGAVQLGAIFLYVVSPHGWLGLP